jgi:hypothetical protein
MKKLFLFTLLTLFVAQVSLAQEKLYLEFDFMKVDNEQENSYAETEAFWEKIHEQRVKNGDIIGWDLWSLQPGGEDQHFQYLTVTLYNDPVKMMSGDDWDHLMDRAKAAYPDMSEEDITKKLNHSSTTRDLAVRIFMELIDATTGDFSMPLGTVASIGLMKVDLDNYSAYEKAESEVFKPMHQTEVDAGRKGSWGLTRFISPIGSDTYASHLTVNMFTNYEQYFMENTDDSPALTDAQIKAIQDGLALREMKFVYMATLLKTVKP